MFKIAEYEALRATIRERGTARMCLILVGVIAWALCTLALNASSEFERAATLIPLVVLVATFEISFFIHTGVERVGRYLQVFYENAPALSEPPSGESKGWETTAMAYGQRNPGGPNPLFVTLFAIIALVNFAASLLTANRHPGWIGISFLAHVAFVWRLVSANRLSAGQRALDLDRFRALKNNPQSK
jgi:cbb3-type cytochrome oxidase subunit 3